MQHTFDTIFPNVQRRQILASATALASFAGLSLIPGLVQAAGNETAFNAKTLGEAIKALGATPVESKELVITSPDIAENGAVVPVTVQSNLPKTQEIYILVEKNPNPLSAVFVIPEGTEASVQTRVKMSQSTNVHALVKAGGKFYTTVKETKVTLGGCGG